MLSVRGSGLEASTSIAFPCNPERPALVDGEPIQEAQQELDCIPCCLVIACAHEELVRDDPGKPLHQQSQVTRQEACAPTDRSAVELLYDQPTKAGDSRKMMLEASVHV